MSSPYDQDPWSTDFPTGDPWAAEPDSPYADTTYDEAQADVPPTNSPTVTKERTISTEGKIVTTIKYGAGFDAPWTVIHANSVEEAKATLNEVKELLALTAKVAKYAKSLDSGTAPAAGRGGNSGGQARQAATPPGAPSKSCAHGEMIYRTGNSAKGPWAGYFCPLEKGNPDQCKPIFVRSK